MGRIEHTLLDEGRASSPTDLRPTPATPLSTPPYHIKLQMFLFATKGRNPARGVVGAPTHDRSRCAEHGESCHSALRGVLAPPGIVILAPPEVPRNAERAPKRRAAPKRLRKATRRGPGLTH